MKKKKKPASPRLRKTVSKNDPAAKPVPLLSQAGILDVTEVCPPADEVDQRVREVLSGEKPHVPAAKIFRSSVLRDPPLLFTDGEVADLAGPLNRNFSNEKLQLTRSDTDNPSITTMGLLSNLVSRKLQCNPS